MACLDIVVSCRSSMSLHVAVVTPTGLQVCIGLREVLATIAVLRSGSKRMDVLTVLKVCDGIEGLPDLSAYAAGLAVALLTGNVWAILAAFAIGLVAGWLLRPVFVWFPGAQSLALLWGYYFALFLRQPLAILAIVISKGWLATLAWIAGSLAVVCLDIYFCLTLLKVCWRLRGVMCESVMLSYVRACRVLARTGKPATAAAIAASGVPADRTGPVLIALVARSQSLPSGLCMGAYVFSAAADFQPTIIDLDRIVLRNVYHPLRFARRALKPLAQDHLAPSATPQHPREHHPPRPTTDNEQPTTILLLFQLHYMDAFEQELCPPGNAQHSQGAAA